MLARRFLSFCRSLRMNRRLRYICHRSFLSLQNNSVKIRLFSYKRGRNNHADDERTNEQRNGWLGRWVGDLPIIVTEIVIYIAMCQHVIDTCLQCFQQKFPVFNVHARHFRNITKHLQLFISSAIN